MAGEPSDNTRCRAFAQPDAHDALEYVAALRHLRAQSELTFREVESRAAANGDMLPYSTLASALRRESLPRRELVDAFVRACGGGREDVSCWLERYDQLAAAEHANPGAPAATPDGSTDERPELPQQPATQRPPTQRPPGELAAAPAPLVPPKRIQLPRPAFAIVTFVVVSWLTLFLMFGEHLVRPVNVQWFTISTPYGTCLDITGEDHLGDPVVLEAPCKPGQPDDQRFARVTHDGVHQLKVYNPNTNGSTWCADIGQRGQLRLNACTSGSQSQLFRIEPSEGAGVRLQPADGRMCFGTLPPHDTAHEVRKTNCAPSPEQEFLMRPA